MTLEVRQLKIKTTVEKALQSERTRSESRRDVEEMKQNILAECRQMVADLLRDNRER